MISEDELSDHIELDDYDECVWDVADDDTMWNSPWDLPEYVHTRLLKRREFVPSKLELFRELVTVEEKRDRIVCRIAKRLWMDYGMNSVPKEDRKAMLEDIMTIYKETSGADALVEERLKKARDKFRKQLSRACELHQQHIQYRNGNDEEAVDVERGERRKRRREQETFDRVQAQIQHRRQQVNNRMRRERVQAEPTATVDFSVLFTKILLEEPDTLKEILRGNDDLLPILRQLLDNLIPPVPRIECGLCQEEFDDYSLFTIDMPCHHLYCSPCLERWREMCFRQDRDATCPQCREHSIYARRPATERRRWSRRRTTDR
jgi:hypothetical protein